MFKIHSKSPYNSSFTAIFCNQEYKSVRDRPTVLLVCK